MTMGGDQTRSGAWAHRAGALASEGWSVVVEPGDDRLDGWRHTGLRVADLDAGERELAAGPVERLVVPLVGGAHIAAITPDGAVHEYELEGRRSVLDGPTDTLYLPPGTRATLRSRPSGGVARVAVAEAPAEHGGPLRRLPGDAAPVELRGRGRSSRQVHDLGTPAVLEAGRLIVCEVITPSGNWSSYPPHKHDEHRPGIESRLEEIYYFEVVPEAGAPDDPDAVAYFSASSSATTEISIDTRVGTGDVVLVPGGYHGPAAAPPGYHLYYLNVMAGPDERAWHITDDPAHAWIRKTWSTEPIDPRLPLGDRPQSAPDPEG
jgi:5-deoxy-glucuronate isomerase